MNRLLFLQLSHIEILNCFETMSPLAVLPRERGEYAIDEDDDSFFDGAFGHSVSEL
jgi:hypothetical protein